MDVEARNDARTKMVSDIQSCVTEYKEVYGSLNLELNGRSPCCTVENDGFIPDFHDVPLSIGFIVTVFVRRDNPTDAETLISTLVGKTISAINRNFRAEFEPTQSDYEVIDGNLYRLEEIRVTVSW